MRTLIMAGDSSHPEHPKMTHVTDPAEQTHLRSPWLAPSAFQGVYEAELSVSRMCQAQC